LTFSKGMHNTIPDHALDMPLPEVSDIPPPWPVPSQIISPFPYFLQMLLHAGRLADVLNRKSGLDWDAAEVLLRQMVGLHRLLPMELSWSTSNFKLQADAKQSVSHHRLFLTLGLVPVPASLAWVDHISV
jgi:hypothetical protein